MFIPSIRSPYSRALRKKVENTLPQRYSKTKKRTYGMVIVPFRHATNFKRFRWKKDWWRKTNFKGGTNSELHELEFPMNEPVGVFLKDLSKESRRWIMR